MRQKIKEYIENALAILAMIALVAVYGLVGHSDYEAEQQNAAYTADIMALAKEEALRTPQPEWVPPADQLAKADQ